MADTPADANTENDFFTVLNTQRAMRRLKPDPVPDELIKKLIWAATRAPSPTNSQGWRYVVITDPETKLKMRDYYKPHWYKNLDAGYGNPRPGMTEEQAASYQRVIKSATYLADNLEKSPVLILVCTYAGRSADIGSGAGIYPAVQNLLLAARALGLGTTLTTLHRNSQPEIRELLGIPENVETAALIPVGWPRGRFGEVYRGPTEEVTYWEKWGETRD